MFQEGLSVVVLGLGVWCWRILLQFLHDSQQLRRQSLQPPRLRRESDGTQRQASVVLGVMASYYTGYLLTKYVGDFYVFVLTTSASTLAFLYGIVRIKNILPQKVSTSSEDNKSIKVTSCTSQIYTLFSYFI